MSDYRNKAEWTILQIDSTLEQEQNAIGFMAANCSAAVPVVPKKKTVSVK